MRLSTNCEWATEKGIPWLHGQCPGHIMLAWSGFEFDCECDCHRETGGAPTESGPRGDENRLEIAGRSDRNS